MQQGHGGVNSNVNVIHKFHKHCVTTNNDDSTVSDISGNEIL